MIELDYGHRTNVFLKGADPARAIAAFFKRSAPKIKKLPILIRYRMKGESNEDWKYWDVRVPLRMAGHKA